MLVVSADRALTKAPHQRLRVSGRSLHSPPLEARSPSGCSRGSSVLPAVPHDSLVGRERLHGSLAHESFPATLHSCAIRFLHAPPELPWRRQPSPFLQSVELLGQLAGNLFGAVPASRGSPRRLCRARSRPHCSTSLARSFAETWPARFSPPMDMAKLGQRPSASPLDVRGDGSYMKPAYYSAASMME